MNHADVLVTSYRTKALDKLGFSYEDLSERFPKLVFAQILGYGEKGPEKDTPGYDATSYVCRGGALVVHDGKRRIPTVRTKCIW